MKNRKMHIISALCLSLVMLASCNGGEPAETTDLPETTVSVETTEAPSEYSVGLDYILIDGNSYAVSGIGECGDRELVIPSEHEGLPVTAIADKAFYNKSKIRSVVIPESVKEIGKEAFYRCLSLDGVTLSDGLETIGESAFNGCNVLGSIVIPESVKSIGEGAFYDCTRLKTVTLPSGLSAIEAALFGGCESLKEIIIPEGVTSIGARAFASCKALEEVILPQGVTFVGESAFISCTSLKAINLPHGITEIGQRALAYTAIEYITLPESLKAVSLGLFSECDSLITVEIPAGVTSIDFYAFSDCEKLESVHIPKSVTSIGRSIFSGCARVISINYSGIPDEWEAIEKHDEWFKGVRDLAVYCIGGTLPMPEVTTLPEETTTIPEETTSLPAETTDPFEETTASSEPEYDGSRGLEYKMMTNYAVLVGIGNCTDKKIVIASSFNGVPVTVIDSRAFYNCAFIEEVIIPEGVTMIRDEAFYLCTNLKKVTLPTTLDIIDDWAFANCESLEKIAIPNRVMWVGQRAFSDCKSLTSVTFGKNLEQIQENSFMNCTSLKSVTIPGKIHYFGNSAFLGCTSLESVTLTKGVNMIGSSVFSGCAKLSSIRYTGSIADWKDVDKSSDWNKNVPVDHVTCSDGDVGFTETYDGTQGVVYRISKDGKSAYLAGMGTFSGSELILATEFNGVPVTDIPNRIINNSPNLKSIYISKSITTLPSQLFYNCDNVVSLTVDPENAVYRSEGNCIIEKRTNMLLFGCNGSVIPEGVEAIREKAFYSCSSLESLTIPEGVEVVGNNAFSSCTALKWVNLPESLASVGDHAFYGCSSLEELKFGAKTETIGNYAFSECAGLKSIALPDAATLGEMAFYNCSSLKSIKIPAAQTSLSGTFWGCSSLESVVMHDKLEALIGGVFMGCTSLGSITLPASVTKISGNTFADCVSLTEFVYEGTVEAWTSINMLTNWKDGAPFTVVKCSDGEARAQILTDTDAIIAAEDYWRVSDSDLLTGGFYIRVKEIPSLESNCFKIVLAKRDSEGNYPIVKEILVDKRTGEISEPVYTYIDIPEAIRKVLFNESTYIFVNHEGSNEINFKDTVLWGGYRAACDSLSYGVADLDGDGNIEVILGTQSSNILLREYGGKVYGYEFANNEISVLFTDGTYSWKKNAGIIQCTSRLTFDGAEVKSVEILRFDRSMGNARKYYVEGVEVTKAEYDAREASFSDEVITYKPLALYPIEIYPPN